MLESASQYVTDFQNRLLRSFYPLSILSRVFGYFPFVSLGKDLATTSEKRKLKYEIIFTLIFLTTMIYNNVWYWRSWVKFAEDVVRDTMHNYYFMSYRVTSVLLLLNFALYKSKTIVTFCRDISLLEASLSKKQQKHLRYFGLLLTFFIICNIGLYVSITHSDYVIHSGYKNDFDYIFLLPGIAGIMFSYNFVSLITIFFCYYFTCQYRNLLHYIKYFLNFNDTDSSDILCDIRKRHEQLVIWVDTFNDMMFPELLIYIIAESVAICVNFYEIFMIQLQSFELLLPIAVIVYVMVRLMPFLLICSTSNNLSNVAELCEKQLDKSSFVTNSTESEFQALLLFDQLERRKVQITMKDVVIVNNYLLFKLLTMSLFKCNPNPESGLLQAFYPLFLLAASFGYFPRCKISKNTIVTESNLAKSGFVFNVICYSINNHYYYTHYVDYNSWIEAIVINHGIVGMIYSYNFVSSFATFFSLYFSCQFQHLSRYMSQIIRFHDKDEAVFCDQLRAVRKRQEQLMNLVQEFNAIMSPAMLLYVVAESFAICLNVSEFCVILFVQNSHEHIDKSFGFIFMRLWPLFVVCITSNNLAAMV
ncbi:hypothetical protein CHUAL_003943 [Chamberlinius hualienensis]